MASVNVGFSTFIVNVSTVAFVPSASVATRSMMKTDGLVPSKNGQEPSIDPVFSSTVQPAESPAKLKVMSSRVPVTRTVAVGSMVGLLIVYAFCSPAVYQYSDPRAFKFGAVLPPFGSGRNGSPLLASARTGENTGFRTFTVKVSITALSFMTSHATRCITNGCIWPGAASAVTGHVPVIVPVFLSTDHPDRSPSKEKVTSLTLPPVTVVLSVSSTGPKNV